MLTDLPANVPATGVALIVLGWMMFRMEKRVEKLTEIQEKTARTLARILEKLSIKNGD